MTKLLLLELQARRSILVFEALLSFFSVLQDRNNYYILAVINTRISNNFIIKNSAPHWVSCWNHLAANMASSLLLNLLDFKSVSNCPRYLICDLYFNKGYFPENSKRKIKILASEMQLWTWYRPSAKCTNNYELLLANKS